MAASGQRMDWSEIDLALVRLVYQNRDILKGEQPDVTLEMKALAWKNIANSLKVRKISTKPEQDLRNRWYRLKERCQKAIRSGRNPSSTTGIIIKSILDNTDRCHCEFAPNLHQNADSQQSADDATEGGPANEEANEDQHSAETREGDSNDEDSDVDTGPGNITIASEEIDLKMKMERLALEKLQLEVDILKFQRAKIDAESRRRTP